MVEKRTITTNLNYKEIVNQAQEIINKFNEDGEDP